MLSIKNISKKFHDKKIIDDVSFDVQPGEVVVLLGRSGVGKSTILRVLNNLETVDDGQILLDHTPIDFKKIGMVFQDFNLFAHWTVIENLSRPLQLVAHKTKSEADQISRETLQRFNIDSNARSYPSSLSGGQKQRVALARALCMKPVVLCLDEPTSALDPQLTNEVASIIMKMAREKMHVVIATHDIGLLQNLSCTIYLMHEGKIIESATTELLQQYPEKFTLLKNFIEGKNA